MVSCGGRGRGARGAGRWRRSAPLVATRPHPRGDATHEPSYKRCVQTTQHIISFFFMLISTTNYADIHNLTSVYKTDSRQRPCS